MSPEEKRQFEEMKAELETIKNTLAFKDVTTELSIKDVTDIDVANGIGAGGGDTFDFPDQWKLEVLEGRIYRSPLYNESRF